MDRIGIYLITCQTNGQPPYYYVGQSCKLKRRMKHHQYQLRAGTHHNRRLQACWNKYGAESMQFEILEECSAELLDELEGWFLSEMYGHSRVLNIGKEPGGGFNRGSKFSDAHRKKIGDANRGEQHYMKTRPISDEHRLNLSKASKGKQKSEETKKRMSDSLRLRARPKGKDNALSKSVIGTSVSTGVTIRFDSAVQARNAGFNNGKISNCIHGHRATHLGHTWAFANLSAS